MTKTDCLIEQALLNIKAKAEKEVKDIITYLPTRRDVQEGCVCDLIKLQRLQTCTVVIKIVDKVLSDVEKLKKDLE